MVLLARGGRIPVLLLLFCLCLCGLSGLSGCGTAGKPDSGTDQLTGSELEQA